MILSFVLNLLIFAAAFVVLIKSTGYLTKILVALANTLKIPEFTTAFVLMAIATTIPEFFVAISSAINKIPAIALGDAIGSNILDLTFIVGLIVIISGGFAIQNIVLKRDVVHMVATALILLGLTLDKFLSRFDGLVLLFVYILFIIQVYGRHRYGKMDHILSEEKIPVKKLAANLIHFVLASALMLIGGAFLVKSGSNLANLFSLPVILIGLVPISIGTSLPELFFGLQAAKKGHPSLTLGDLSGAFVANISLILGITALLYPARIENSLPYFLSLGFLIVAALVFGIFCTTKKRLSWHEGLILIFTYILFLFIEIIIR